MYRPTILLVDNDQDHLASWRDRLTQEGYQVLSAENTTDAKMLLASQLIHLAILDVRLKDDKDSKDRSGLEFNAEIDPLVARVIFTGHPPEELDLGLFPAKTRIECANGQKMVYLVTKKQEPSIVLSAIEKALEEEFEMIPKDRFAILTSGGDSPGMNAAIWAAVRTAMANDVEIIGIYEGYRGLVDDRAEKLRWSQVSDIAQQGGTILCTSRYPEFKDPEVRRPAIEAIKRKHISGLIVIGGDGSMNGARELAKDLDKEDWKLGIIGLPGTIDNDLFGTDMSLGAASAVNAMICEFNNMLRPAQALRRIFVGEVMGRYCGYLALQAALGIGANAVLLPESVIQVRPSPPNKGNRPWQERINRTKTESFFRERLDEIAERLEHERKTGKLYGFIVLAEGIGQLTEGRLNGEYVRKYLEDKMEDWQPDPKPDIRAHVLGYPVRGVPPCQFDLWLGATMGAEAVLRLLDSKTDIMLGWTEEQGIIETAIDDVVAKSNRPPQEIWQDRPKWQRMLKMQEMLACPPNLRDQLEGNPFVHQE